MNTPVYKFEALFNNGDRFTITAKSEENVKGFIQTFFGYEKWLSLVGISREDEQEE